ncbi:down syndrome cell adhesion molecule-like protein Dscam2 [Trichonephila clavata]|uniref:Down syndrome cell adhesion molecule-like protein Dscam2 n=1 Tax=Trichonephila clavata TaxID=2740835 RepID=A0A8X6GQX6_TRICU|nr:down syndrome cell adhesion molecule-like protein Dscam2 [Trichonephila clavata]
MFSFSDERVLPVNQRQRVFPNGTLLIMAMQPGVDDGLYSCEVSPGQDMTAVSRSFRIIIRSESFSIPFVKVIVVNVLLLAQVLGNRKSFYDENVIHHSCSET